MSAISLHLAAFDGDNDAVNQLLADGADANARTSDGETPLLFAAAGGHTPVVRTLLKYGADVNALPTEGASALRRALRWGHAEIVRLLLARGADPNAVPPPRAIAPEAKAQFLAIMRESQEKHRKASAALGIEKSAEESPFDRLFADEPADKPEPKPEPEQGEFRCVMLAVQSRDEETVKAVLDAGYSPNPARKDGINPLEFAAGTGADLPIVRLLLQYGADPNGSGRGVSLLMAAVMRGDIAFAQLLLDAGARTNDDEGIGPLAFAIQMGKTEMAEFLVERGIGINDPMLDTFVRSNNQPALAEKIAQKRGTAWLSLVRAGDANGVRTALQNGADLRVKDGGDGSALRIAIRKGDTNMVRVLLDAGADARDVNDYGNTPLHEAARIGSVEIIDLLLTAGASVRVINRFGRTPLTDAAVSKHAEAADRLITGGATLDAAEALLLGRREVAERMWQNGTPVDYAGSSGLTALHAAAARGETELVALLLDRGANPNAVDRAQKTALLYALETENVGLVTLLLDRGASPSGKGAKEDTPLYQAAVLLRSEPLTRLLLERGAPLIQSIPPDIAERLAKADIDPDVARRTLEQKEQSEQLVPQLFFTHRAMNKPAREGEDERPVAAKWRETEGLWAVLRTLIEFGAEVNAPDDRGNTTLCRLIELDAPFDLIQTVLAKGARVNPTSTVGQAPLMLATERGRADVARLLLAAGANPNGGVSQQSALEVARAANLPEMVAVLEEYGATDAAREAILADLGDERPFFLRTRPKPGDGAAGITMPNLADLQDSRNAERMAKREERRTRLQAEVAQNENAST